MQNDKLTALRTCIDDCDRELTKLFCRRMELSSQIASVKRENHLPVLDSNRERILLERVQEQADPLYADAIRVLYSSIFSLSRARQQRLLRTSTPVEALIHSTIAATPAQFPTTATVAVQGIRGAYSQKAANSLFEEPDITFCPSFVDVFNAIEKGICRYGVVPIENNTAGSVSNVYDLLYRHKLYIVRAVRVKIEHCLFAKPGTTLNEVREVYSHEQALHQSRRFLERLPGVKIIACSNTAEAAHMVALRQTPGIAALSSRACGEIYGLSMLADSVQDNPGNHTRFLCISKTPEIYPGASKTTLMTATEDKPGALYDLLQQFFVQGMNLTKLESRPIPEEGYAFMFCMDVVASVYSPQLLELLEALAFRDERFRYLGSYSEI